MVPQACRMARDYDGQMILKRACMLSISVIDRTKLSKAGVCQFVFPWEREISFISQMRFVIAI